MDERVWICLILIISIDFRRIFSKFVNICIQTHHGTIRTFFGVGGSRSKVLAARCGVVLSLPLVADNILERFHDLSSCKVIYRVLIELLNALMFVSRIFFLSNHVILVLKMCVGNN